MKKRKVFAIFGTRPEAIKMAPVIKELQSRPDRFNVQTLVTSQHTDLLFPLLSLFDITPQHILDLNNKNKTLNQLVADLLNAIDPIIRENKPDIILVQGDTSSTLAGAMVAHHYKIELAHIEAGLRSGNRYSPFPEEINRRLITQLATLHMAATQNNANQLHCEGIPASQVYLTGNTIVDALNWVLQNMEAGPEIKQLLSELTNLKVIVLTSHRRENFGQIMSRNMEVLRDFVATNEDLALVFPVHPNPAVRELCGRIFQNNNRIKIIEPLIYPDFLYLLHKAWIIASDSGGIQEEAPTLCKPLLILRENTERPEVLECGCAKLVGTDPEVLRQMLQEVYSRSAWVKNIETIVNPFGDGKAATRIADILESKIY